MDFYFRREPVLVPANIDLSKIVGNKPKGTIFQLPSTLTISNDILPLDGQMFIGPCTISPAAGANVKHAFYGSAKDVVLNGIVTADGFKVPSQDGVISAKLGTDWIVKECYIKGSPVYGIRVGEGSQILYCAILQADCLGIGGGGSNIRIENNSINNCNTSMKFDPFVEAGGIKLAYCKNSQVMGNRINSCNGPGVWADLECSGISICVNEIISCMMAGIMYEVSCQAIIHANKIIANCYKPGTEIGGIGSGAGIYISESQLVTVTENIIIANNLVNPQAGIGLRNLKDRGASSDGIPFILDNIVLNDNRIYTPKPEWLESEGVLPTNLIQNGNVRIAL